MKLHWYDSETTGIIPSEPQQMLSFALKTTDLNLNTIAVLDEKLRLRSDVNPTKEALAINKIDPFSLEWFSQSLNEEDFCSVLNTYLEKNFTEGDIFIAYSANFDNRFIKETYKRNKKFFLPSDNFICFDPLKMVRKAVAEGKVITPRKMSKDGKWFNSSTLDDVSAVLGTRGQGRSHTALTDVETLIGTAPKVYNLLTGESFEHFLKQNEYRVQF